MHKNFHNLILGVSVLPALLVMPAFAYNIEEDIDLNTVFEDGVISEELVNSKTGKTGTLTTPDITITGDDIKYLVLVEGAGSVINLGTSEAPVDSINIKDTGANTRGITVWDGGAANVYAKDINIEAESQGFTTWGNHAAGLTGTGTIVGENINISASNAIYVNEDTSVSVTGKEITLSGDNGIAAWTGFKYDDEDRFVGYYPGSGGKVSVDTDNLTINATETGIGANYMQSQVTVNATGDVNIVAHGSDDTRAIHAGNSTTDPDITKENTSFVSVKAKNINLKADNIGVSAMSNGFVDLDGNVTIAARDAILARGAAQVTVNKSGENTVKMNGNIDFDYDKATSGSTVDALVDVTLAGSKSYWTGNTTASYGSGKAPDESYMKVNSVSLTMKDGAVWNATKIVDNMNDDTSGSGYVALNNLNIDKGTVNIADAKRGIVVENAIVKDATFNGGPLNFGTMMLTGGENSFNTNVSGIDADSKLIVDADTIMNIGTNIIAVDTMSLNGTLNATLLNTNKFASLAVNNFDAESGSMVFTLKGVGDYKVFQEDVFDNSKIEFDYDKSLFDDPVWNEDNNTLTVSMRPVEDIAKNTGIAGDSAVAVSHVAEAASNSDSVQLQSLSLKLQEQLAKGNTDAVEHATKAVHPETESVKQSVSSSVQNTVVNLAASRMSAPRTGRNGGDAKLTAGGVWVQGLFNKSKHRDTFNGYTRGIALGLDGTINRRWTIGAGYSYAHSDINGTARTTEVDSNTLFLYGQYKPSQWYLNAIANYTMSDYSEKGTVIDNTPIFGDYSVDSFGGALATGYDFRNGITPELGLRYMHVNANDYANSYGIKTYMNASDFLTGIVGAKYAFKVVANKYTTFMPQLNAGLKYDMLSDANIATVTMPGVNAYTLDGGRLNRVGGEFGIGLGIRHGNLEVSVNYDIDVRKDYTSQTGMLKLRANF